MNAERLFTAMTERLLKERRISGFFGQAPASAPTDREYNAFNEAFKLKRAAKGGGRQLFWGDWLVESLFPKAIYAEHGSNLRKMIKDDRIWQLAGFSGNDNNSFGRLCMPRPELPEGYISFMLDRIAGRYGSMPLYYFDVESPAWVCAPLSERPDVPKTNRTSVSCVMNYGFHVLDGVMSISVIVRHCNWSHLWGDVFGADAALRAVCKEAKLKVGQVSVFANSATMDEPKIAKHYLQYSQG